MSGVKMISPTGAAVAVPEEELGIYEVVRYAVMDKPEVVGEPEPVKAGGMSKEQRLGMWVDAEQSQDEWIGYDTPTDENLITAWLGKVERMIRQRAPSLVVRIEAGEPDLLDNMRDVVIAMATRVFRNPEGLRSVNSTSGQLTKSITYGGEAPSVSEILPVELVAPTGGRRGYRRAGGLSMVSPYSPFYQGG